MKSTILLKAIFDNAINGLIPTNDPLKTKSINLSVCRSFNYTKAKMLGGNVPILIPSLNSCDLGFSELKYLDKITNVTPPIYDLTKQKEKQLESMCEDYATQLKHKHKHKHKRTVILQNNNHVLPQTKEELGSFFKKEKEQGKLKNRFVWIIAYVFQTQLNLIQLLVSIAKQHTTSHENPNINEHIGKIRAIALNTMVLNDFFLLENHGTGKIMTEFSHFDLMRQVQEITKETQIVLKNEQKIIFKHRSYNQLTQLNQNLSKNCIISIPGNGIDIANMNLKQMFAGFFRGYNTDKIAREAREMGIHHRYRGLMNGKRNSHNRINKGMIFTYTFPRL